MILNATPYPDLPGMFPVRYISDHWWREGNGFGIRERIAARIKAQPAWAYLIDSETSRDAGRIGEVVEVLRTIADLHPLSERFVYDAQLRVTTPSQRDAAIARATARTGNQADQDFYAWSTAIVRDVYWMAEPTAKATPYAIDHAKTMRGLDAYLSLNAEVMAHESALFNLPVWPCVHERYARGHGAGSNLWMTPTAWAWYVAKVRAQWPELPVVWWSGSMDANPGVPGEGYVKPAEDDLRERAEKVM